MLSPKFLLICAFATIKLVSTSDFDGEERCLNADGGPCIRSRSFDSSIPTNHDVDDLKRNVSELWIARAKGNMARQLTNFTLDLEKHIYRVNSVDEPLTNIVFSPVNIAMFLALLSAGSVGRTLDEISTVLGFQRVSAVPTEYSEIYQQLFGEMVADLNKPRNGTQLDILSNLYIQTGYDVRPEYRKLIKYLYDSDVARVNFARDGYSVARGINEWIAYKTHGLFRNILNVPDPRTKAIVVSLIYFNGEWREQFDESFVRKHEFTIEEDRKIETQLMFNTGVYAIAHDKVIGASMLELPYAGNEMSMYVLLPSKHGAKALRSFTEQLTVDTLEIMIDRLAGADCLIALPKMNLTSGEVNLNHVLGSMGVTSLFSPNDANLGLMSSSKSTTKRYRRPNQHDRFAFPVDDDSEEYSSSRRKYHQRSERPSYSAEFFDYLLRNRFTSFGLDELRRRQSDEILSNPYLYISDAMHKARIDINERGTAAAAITYGITFHSALTQDFIVDRPFLLFIRHNPSKMMLFWATVNSPTM